MPERVCREAVDVLLELPRESRLADARDTGDEHELSTLLLLGGVEEILDELQLAVATHERRFETGGAHRAAPARDDAQRAPELHRLGLALQLVLAGVLVGDRRLGGALGCVAREHGAGLGCRLDAGSGVDEVARDHALIRGAERDGGFAGEDPGPGAEQRVDLGDRGGEVERGPDGPLGVVLLRDGCTPDGHHRVADELLDGAAVALDHRAGDVEVAGQEVARVLRVASFGGGGEPDEVDEEHRDEAALCRRRLGRAGCDRSSCGGAFELRAALAAELDAGCVRCTARRACRGQARAALATELAAVLVGRLTRGADHVGSLCRIRVTILRAQRLVWVSRAVSAPRRRIASGACSWSLTRGPCGRSLPPSYP